MYPLIFIQFHASIHHKISPQYLIKSLECRSVLIVCHCSPKYIALHNLIKALLHKSSSITELQRSVRWGVCPLRHSIQLSKIKPNLYSAKISPHDFRISPCVGQWSVQWDVWCGSWCAPGLCTLLFILTLEALWCEFCTGVPWELPHAYDLVVTHKHQVSRKIFSLILICFLFVVLLGT